MLLNICNLTFAMFSIFGILDFRSFSYIMQIWLVKKFSSQMMRSLLNEIFPVILPQIISNQHPPPPPKKKKPEVLLLSELLFCSVADWYSFVDIVQLCIHST